MYKEICTLNILKTQRKDYKSKLRTHHSSSGNWQLTCISRTIISCWTYLLDTRPTRNFFLYTCTINVYASTYVHVSCVSFMQGICLTAYHTQVDACICPERITLVFNDDWLNKNYFFRKKNIHVQVEITYQSDHWLSSLHILSDKLL